jgi:hypothetical protein
MATEKKGVSSSSGTENDARFTSHIDLKTSLRFGTSARKCRLDRKVDLNG